MRNILYLIKRELGFNNDSWICAKDSGLLEKKKKTDKGTLFVKFFKELNQEQIRREVDDRLSRTRDRGGRCLETVSAPITQ